MIVVSNATPLIALAKLERLALLQELFGTVQIPEAVHEEVVARAPNRPGAAEVGQAAWITVGAPEDRSHVNYLRADLDPGEAEVLILAEELDADWVLLDELRARVAAEMLEIRCIGTVGLLLLAKRMGHVGAVRPLLDELREKKFFLSDKVYQAVLRRAGE